MWNIGALKTIHEDMVNLTRTSMDFGWQNMSTRLDQSKFHSKLKNLGMSSKSNCLQAADALHMIHNVSVSVNCNVLKPLKTSSDASAKETLHFIEVWVHVQTLHKVFPATNHPILSTCPFISLPTSTSLMSNSPKPSKQLRSTD